MITFVYFYIKLKLGILIPQYTAHTMCGGILQAITEWSATAQLHSMPELPKPEES